MTRTDYTLRTAKGIGWIAHRRRVGTRILQLTATLGAGSMLFGFYLGNSVIIVGGMTLLLGSAALSSF